MQESKFYKIVGFTRAFACTLVCVLACALICTFSLIGCSTNQEAKVSEEEEAIDANQEYMSDLNQYTQKLSEEMESFAEAVSRGDVVTMQSQADNAYKVLTDIESLQAPDDLKDLHTGYTEACEKLRTALNDYISLYSEITSSSADGSFDYSTYSERLNEIQKQYDDAIAQLESTDNTATEI